MAKIIRFSSCALIVSVTCQGEVYKCVFPGDMDPNCAFMEILSTYDIDLDQISSYQTSLIKTYLRNE